MPCRSLLFVAFVAFIVAADRSEQPAKPSLSEDEKTILDFTNKARAEQKLQPLTVNPLLTNAARAHSKNMANKAEMNHVLDGKNPGDRVKSEGYKFSRVGENIAYGENVTVARICQGWMDSKPHRENILSDMYREIGIGIARNDKGQVYYTQVFGTALNP
jgi:uncharacterized protein YkwD